MVRFRVALAVGLVAAWLAASPARVWAADDGTIKGKVIFKGDKDKYKRTVLDTSKDPNCKKSKDKIGNYEVVLNTKGDPITVRNVLVSIKNDFAGKTFTAPTEPKTLTQHGCEYDPHVLGLVEGQGLKVLNGDDTNHNIHFLPKKNEEHNFSQPKKDAETGKELKLVAEAEPFKIKCDVHPWMGAWIGVYKHPFFAVTGEDGTFEIKNLPPGKYTVEAWHETFGKLTAEAEARPGSVSEQDFTFEPK